MEEIHILLELIYPPVCGFCGKIDSQSLCKKCEIKLKKEEKYTYIKTKEKYFEEQLYFFEYNGEIREKIIQYKFNEKSYLYKTFVKFIIKNKKAFEILKTYDIIIPVPISRKRKKDRGYNQSLLIAKELEKNINKEKKQIELVHDCIYKTKDIIEQSKLKKEERILNVQNVYELKNTYKINNKKIILIDDVYTTGSTLNECSRILKTVTSKKIGVLTIASDELK